MDRQHNIVSVSGGKNSTVLLTVAVAMDVPNLEAAFADTGHERPLTYAYVDYLSDWLQQQGHPPIPPDQGRFHRSHMWRRANANDLLA